jgi:hypothetical protein
MSSNSEKIPQQLSSEDIQRLKDQGAVIMSWDEISSGREALLKNKMLPEIVEKWYHRGGFFDPQRGKDSIEQKTFLRLLAEAKSNTFTFWTRDGFEPDMPPELHHHGLSVCFKCGWVYWSNFDDDAMDHQDGHDVGQVCLPCLVTIWRSAESDQEAG